MRNGDGLLDDVNLREIIKDRKMERKQEAEKKRQVDLQRIKDMKSTEGVHPLKLFPKVVWEHILEELDPEDQWSLWQIHPLFRDLMEDSRTRDILLPLALRINEMRRYIRCIAPSNAFPFAWKKYPVCIYGRLRQVSKSLRNAMDRWVEDDIQKKVDGLDDGEGSSSTDSFSFGDPRVCVRDDEEKMSTLKKMLASFESSNTNPAKCFYPKGIHISLPTHCHGVDDIANEGHVRENEFYNEFKKDVIALLNIIGGQLLRFSVFIYTGGEREWKWEEVNLAAVYILLQQWACLMPNLRWIEVNVEVDAESFPSERDIYFPPSVLRQYPFPRLNALERVRFHHNQSNPALVKPKLYEMHKAILKANMGISKLNIEDAADVQLELIPEHCIKYLRLTSFSVIHHNWRIDQVENFRLTLERVRPFTQCEWMKLKTIELDLHDPLVFLHDTLQFLESFPTLEKVSLKFEAGVKVGYEDEDTFRYLKLPNLTDLELKLNEPDIDYEDNIYFFFSLQFLLYCKKLETFRWTLHGIDDKKLRSHLMDREYKAKGNLLDFRAGLRVLHESKIWKVFPKLTTVEVEGLKEGSGFEQECGHQYRRLFAGESESVTQFLDGHVCCYNYRLSDCVMLYT